VVDTSNVGVNSSGGVLIGGALQRSNITGYSPKITMAQVYDWTLSVQQELAGNLLLEGDYSPSAAHHLPVLNNPNINRLNGDLIVNKGVLQGLNP
jgi:hypothetical protein